MAVVEAAREFTFVDLDRTLRGNILDYIDYKYRFREDGSQTIEDIVAEEISNLYEMIKDFYKGLVDIKFLILEEDIIREYENTFME